MAEENATPTVEELTATIAELQEQLARQKKATDNASADASKWKQDFRKTQTEQERKEAENNELLNTLKSELSALKEEKRVSGNKAKLLSIGYDEATANAMADKIAADVGDEFFNAQKIFLDGYKTKIDNENLAKQSALSSGVAITSDDIEKQKEKQLGSYFGL